jgi:hypothetical protein
MSTPGGRDALLVTDISRAREGKFEEVASWRADFPDPGLNTNLPSASPQVVSEYRVLPYNDPARCGQFPQERDRRSSFSSHNPTVTKHLGLVAWHSAGLQVFTTADPAHPAQVAEFLPEPLEAMATEDPTLSSGLDTVVMGSYPVIQDGLIYVVDIRNGL